MTKLMALLFCGFLFTGAQAFAKTPAKIRGTYDCGNYLVNIKKSIVIVHLKTSSTSLEEVGTWSDDDSESPVTFANGVVSLWPRGDRIRCTKAR